MINQLIDLVLPIDIVCDECQCFKKLVPYKGNQINEEEPDRLVCPGCGKEFAISMNNDKRQIRRLAKITELKAFWDQFVKAC